MWLFVLVLNMPYEFTMQDYLRKKGSLEEWALIFLQETARLKISKP